MKSSVDEKINIPFGVLSMHPRTQKRLDKRTNAQIHKFTILYTIAMA